MRTFAVLIVALALAGSASANLLSNSSFNDGSDNVGLTSTTFVVGTGTLNQWYATADWAIVDLGTADDPPTNDGDFEAVKSSSVYGTYQDLVQIIPMPAAGSYDLTYNYINTGYHYMRAVGISDGETFDLSSSTGGGHTALWTSSSVPIATGAGTYTDTLTLDGTSTEQYLAFYLRADGATAQDITLTPEPASLSLIGLGALALLRRRRA